MDIPGEIEALRGEQSRLKLRLATLDERITALERFNASAPGPAVELPPPPILTPAPSFSAPPAPVETPVIAPPPILPPPLPPPPPPPPPARDSLELRLGRVWLVRIGIVILLTGLVLLGNYAYHEFIGRIGPAGKLALLYLAGLGLGALGGWLARRSLALRNYGRVLLAGGCATIYYATYAAHFVPGLQVIESPLIGGALLLALGGAFVALADRRRSQLLAGATIGLSYYVAAINAVATFSLFSNLVISVAAVALLARRRWASVTFISLLGSYGSYAFWRVAQTHSLLPLAAPDTTAFLVAVLFPAAYWVVHTVAGLLRRTNGLEPAARPAFLTLNNAAFFALAGPAIAGTYPDAFWLATLAFGALLLALAAFAARRAPEEPGFDGAYLAQGLGLVLLGFLFKFTGWQLAISFALLSGTLVMLGRLRHGGIHRFFAGVCALVATLTAVHGLDHNVEAARLTAAAVAVILLADTWLLRRSLGFAPGCDWRALGFAGLSGLVAAIACVDADFLPSALRILTVAAVAFALLRWHRLPEAAYVAQPLALAGQALLGIAFFQALGPNLPTLASAALGLLFVHVWQAPPSLGLAGRRFWPALHCVIPVGLVIAWTFEQPAAAERAPLLALAAILVLAHAFATQAWVLIAASIPFTIFALGTTAVAIGNQVAWLAPALATSMIAAQSLVLRLLGTRSPYSASQLQISGRALRALALALGVAMIFAYLPGKSWFVALAAGGLALLLLARAARSGEAWVYAATFAAIASATWIIRLPLAPAHWVDVFGFLAFAVAQRLDRSLAPRVQVALCVFVGAGTWILLHRLVGEVAGGFLITVSWSLLAMGVLLAGFVLRERAYRLLGLFILAAAVARIFAVDIWQIETIYRILSALVLGVTLLAIGFIYNRFAETLRRWL